MPEEKENVNENAVRRKRIFQLFKRFHPDVFSGTEHEETASELTKALTAILDLEVGEAMPSEFARVALPIVFLDDEGNTLRSKTPFTIPASSEDFIAALEYIVTNKKAPEANSKSNENFNPEGTTAQEKIIATLNGQIAYVVGVQTATRVINNIQKLAQDSLLSEAQSVELINLVQEKMVQFAFKEIQNIVGSLTASGILRRLKEWTVKGLLSAEDYSELVHQVQGKYAQLIADEIKGLAGPGTKAMLLKKIQKNTEENLLSRSQAIELSQRAEDQLVKLRQSGS